MRTLDRTIGWLLVAVAAFVLGFAGYAFVVLGNEYGYGMELAPVVVLALAIAAVPAVMAQRFLSASRTRRALGSRGDTIPM